jgi:hypothetical protein
LIGLEEREKKLWSFLESFLGRGGGAAGRLVIFRP